MRNNGFSLIEVVVTVFVVGLVASIAVKALNLTEEARMFACCEDFKSCETLVEQAAEQTYPRTPTWQEVQGIAGNRWKDHYHYVPNNSDANAGHGNDLDLCDEENPGASTENRDCLNIRFVIVCDHNHGELADYNAVLDGIGPVVFPVVAIDSKKPKKGEVKEMFQTGNGDEFLRGLTYWRLANPNFTKWVSR